MLRSLICPATPLVDREDPRLAVRTRDGALGEALYVPFSATPHAIERSRADTRAASPGCYFLLRQTGSAPTWVEAGAGRQLAQGDCILGDADSPFLARSDGELGYSFYLLPKWMVDATLTPNARERLLRGLAAPAGTPMGR